MKARSKHAIVVASALIVLIFIAALSDRVYAITSPTNMMHFVIVRKLYSIVAFGIVGSIVSAMWRHRFPVVASMVIVAFFSALIEIGQKLTGSQESLKWNAIDVACGAIGGAPGAAVWRLLLEPVIKNITMRGPS